MATKRPLASFVVSSICLLGLVATWVVFYPRGEGTAALAATDEPLVRELAELRRTQERTAEVLARLEGLLADRLVAPATPEPALRRPLGDLPSPASFEELARSLDDLRATLERESSRTQALLRSAPALGGERLVDGRERRRETDWAALDDLEQHWRSDPRAADRSQYLQTSRDLLEAYGPPTVIYRPQGGGLLFHYRRVPDDAAGSSWYFRLQDGMVVEFFVEEDETGEDG